MLGNTTGLFLDAYANASSNVISFSYMRYAMTQVADRETPAKQWTSVPPPLYIPSFMNAIAAGKCHNKF